MWKSESYCVELVVLLLYNPCGFQGFNRKLSGLFNKPIYSAVFYFSFKEYLLIAYLAEGLQPIGPDVI